METRNLSDIRREVEEASERRAALWHELSIAADSEKAAEVNRLNARLEALWSEARAAKSRARFGAHPEILKRARADERLERDLGKVA